MPTQEAELIRQFRRNPQEARDMIVEMVTKSADMFHAELDEAIQSVASDREPQLN